MLSNAELYYSQDVIDDSSINIIGAEAHHISEVMRHKINDEIFVTDGEGNIYKCQIESISNKNVGCKIIDQSFYQNNFSKITFCLPRIKNNDRLEFALEKSIELGITNFIVFESKRTVAKGGKLERWNKIAISSMKQSLRAWLPQINYEKKITNLFKYEGKKIFFDQNAKQTLNDFLNRNINSLVSDNYYFLFGPEGGFDNDELRIENYELSIRLTDNRLRSETAVISAAVILSTHLK